MEIIVFFAAAALFVIFVFVQGYFMDKKEQKYFEEKLRKIIGKEPDKEYKIERFIRIPGYYEKHPREFQIDDITWNDLNMDDIFQRMNYCISSTGEEYLYYMLRTPRFDEAVLRSFDEKVEYFVSHEDDRIAFQIQMKRLGTTGKFSLYDYIDYLTKLGKRTNHKDIISILVCVLLIIVLFYEITLGILGLVAWMLYQIFSYFKVKREIEPYITSLAYIMRMLSVAHKIEKQLPESWKEEIQSIDNALEQLKKAKKGAFWIFNSGSSKTSGNPLDIIFDYVRMVFHVDLISFNHMLGEFILHQKDIDMLVSTMGYLESAISVGLYRASLVNGYAKPEFVKTGLCIEEGYHPLITAPVKNSITAECGVLLTGSNASGKSTFLKMLALNILTAQTIYTVTSKQYQAPCAYLYSSMSLRDSLESNESYYIVEIKSIKRILDGYKSGKRPIFCFVDEVLRGTNTVERIAASTQILNSMNGEGIQCFAATHDIELTHLLEDIYDNYHFEEEIKEGDILFNYQLRSGRATTRNAIKLLEIIGYDDNVIEKAQKQAKIFLEEGIWKRP